MTKSYSYVTPSIRIEPKENFSKCTGYLLRARGYDDGKSQDDTVGPPQQVGAWYRSELPIAGTPSINSISIDRVAAADGGDAANRLCLSLCETAFRESPEPYSGRSV